MKPTIKSLPAKLGLKCLTRILMEIFRSYKANSMQESLTKEVMTRRPMKAMAIQPLKMPPSLTQLKLLRGNRAEALSA